MAPQSRRRTLAVIGVWSAGELLIVAGAFIGSRLHRDNALVALLWVVPGIGLGIWGMELFERRRGRSFGLFTGKIVFFFAVFPGILLGSWLADAVA